MPCLWAVCGALVLLALALGVEAGDALRWEPVGPGGGGGIFNPAISPLDPNLVFVSCDMSGFYRSEDGCRSWRMLDGCSVRNISCPPVFNPRDDHIIFVGARGGLKRSTDRGLTWTHLLGQDRPRRPDQVTAIAIDPERTDTLWVAFSVFDSEPGGYLFRSDDGGATWQRLTGWPRGEAPVLGLFVDPTSPPETRRLFAATHRAVWRSDDGGRRWSMKRVGTLGLRLNHFGAGTAPGFDSPILYVTLRSQVRGGRFIGGVYRSTDGGDSWRPVLRGLNTRIARGGRRRIPDYGLLAVCARDARVAYVGSRAGGRGRLEQSTVYRTTDAGEHWEPVLFGDRRYPPTNVEDDWLTLETDWWWGGTAIGLTCRATDPDDVIFTDAGRALRTTDGGRRWFPIYTRRVRGRLWRGIGLEVTTCYDYLFDPHDPQRTYITYTDIGFFLSPDRGRSWQHGAKGTPWSNTCYEVAFDPEVPGLLWGAWGNAHDLPHWKMLHRGTPSWWRGGVCRSTDFGAHWEPLGLTSGLPEGTTTTILLDPTSPKGRRTLFAGIIGHGVYRSTDGGESWLMKSEGIDLKTNANVWRLARAADGTLYCAVTIAYRDGKPVPGALYRSRDRGEHWELVNTSQPLPWIYGLRVEPGNPDVLYVACFDVPAAGFAAMGSRSPWPRTEGGGLYKSTDAGATWKRILDVPQVWDVSFDPRDPRVLYACTFARGVFRSDDGGETWRPLEGLPFVNTHRVTCDPTDPDTIYVTTFGGGVWKTRLQ